MSKRIVVNVGLLETRVAVQEGNLLTELYLERQPSPVHRGQRVQGHGDERPARHAGRVRRHRPQQGRLPLRRGLHRQSHRRRSRHAGRGRRGRRSRRRGRRRRGAQARGDRAHRGDAEPGPGSPGPGLQGVAGHQGRPRHVVHLDSRPLRRLHAAGASRRRLAPHPGRARAGPPAGGAAQSEAAARRLHLADQRRGQGRGGVRPRRRVPVPPVVADPGALRDGQVPRRAARGDGPDVPGRARSLLARGGRVRGGRPRRLRQVRGLRPGAGRRRWRSACGSTPSARRSSTPSASRRTSRRRCAGGCG